MNLTGKAPLGLKKPKLERGTKAAKEHLHRVKQLPCVICHKPGHPMRIMSSAIGSAQTK